ncbi:hypothetical protein N9X24_00090 [Rickettsiales bacterium]|nr:hypothetical protein [Rickettsiales bacterium]
MGEYFKNKNFSEVREILTDLFSENPREDLKTLKDAMIDNTKRKSLLGLNRAGDEGGGDEFALLKGYFNKYFNEQKVGENRDKFLPEQLKKFANIIDKGVNDIHQKVLDNNSRATQNTRPNQNIGRRDNMHIINGFDLGNGHRICNLRNMTTVIGGALFFTRCVTGINIDSHNNTGNDLRLAAAVVILHELYHVSGALYDRAPTADGMRRRVEGWIGENNQEGIQNDTPSSVVRQISSILGLRRRFLPQGPPHIV